MRKPSVVPTERLIYQLYDYTCDGTINTFIDTGIKLFGLEYDAFRIEMEYDGLDLTQSLETLIECKAFSGSGFTNGLSIKVSGSSQPLYSNALATNIYPCITEETFKNTSSATVILTYNRGFSCSIDVNGSTKTGSGIIFHEEPLTIGGRYSSRLSNPDRFVQVHISSLKIYAIPSGTDTSYIYLPLTFKCLTGGDLSIKNSNAQYDRNFEYSLNGGAWTAFTLLKNTASKLIATLSPNDIISFRRDNENFYQAQFISDSNLTFDIYGNLLSLQYGANFNGQTTLRNTTKQAFGPVFKGTNVVDASKLMLTATELSSGCYYEMFSDCSNLINPPSILPATVMSSSCYYGLFNNCQSLTTFPTILATTLAEDCFRAMFRKTAISTAPPLPYATIKARSYYAMFQQCQNLNYVKCLATNAAANGGDTYGWLEDVSPTGTFVKASGVTWPTGVSGIPNGWTVIEE